MPVNASVNPGLFQMQKLIVRGGNTLRGELAISGSKNTALPLMAGAILGNSPSTLTNIPGLRDVSTFRRVIEVTGVETNHDTATRSVVIDPSRIDRFEAPYELVKRMRASFYMLGALLGKAGEARVSLPGGCAWGPRPVDLHIKGMEALGAVVELEQGYVNAKAVGGRLEGGVFRLDPSSVGATINFLLGAATARGPSRLENAAREPDVVVFGEYLIAMGAQIEGLGTETIEIEGVDTLTGVAFANCPDRIELGTFMIAAAMCGSPDEPVRMKGGDAKHLGDTFTGKFLETGASISLEDNDVLVTAPEQLEAVSITTEIYPGFPTDLQAQWTVMQSQATGNSRIVDNVYKDRFKHIPELQRMGLQAIVVDNAVAIQGQTQLTGAQVMSTDLRASVSLVLAGMVARGETHVQRIYHLDRGYENLEAKLAGAGVDIERVEYDEFADPAPSSVVAES